jgi:hypothetical protein
VIVAWAINILELSVNYRRNISIGDCGMNGNIFATLGKILMAWFRL